ncbi:MAG TPA: hypothetical protein VM925_16345, partial [Labilithrix sp.]|nr:hypothetical protein [Labilithrix sp.]
MRISWRRVSLLLPGLVLACSVESKSNDESSSSSSTSPGSSSSSGGGGCGGGSSSLDERGGGVEGAPVDDSRRGAPSEPAPTGQ